MSSILFGMLLLKPYTIFVCACCKSGLQNFVEILVQFLCMTLQMGFRELLKISFNFSTYCKLGLEILLKSCTIFVNAANWV
jgi:hypothetical protein